MYKNHYLYLQNQLYVHDLASGNKLSQLPLEVGTIVGFSGKKKLSEVCFIRRRGHIGLGLSMQCSE